MKKIVIGVLTILSIGIIGIFITNIDTTKAANTTLANKVIQLAGTCTSWNSGFSGVCKTNNHEYRYVGANVDNWVKFNDDMYRIIGVFDSNSTGTSGNLVKLIRARSIGAYSWGCTNASSAYTTYSTYNSNWQTASANILLNEFFYNASDTSTTYKKCIDWTYFYNSNDQKTKDCSKIMAYGIQTATLRNYIQPVTWYLKGEGSFTVSKQDCYTCERSDTTTIEDCYKSSATGAVTKVTSKRFGLMYVSDFLYASGYYSSGDTTHDSGYNFGQQNWLYNGLEWTITPFGNTSNYGISIDGGFLYTINTYYPREIRPTFYLKSSVYVTGGSGKYYDPYTISI